MVREGRVVSEGGEGSEGGREGITHEGPKLAGGLAHAYN